MIDYEQYCRIRQLKEDGLQAGQIGREMGLDRRTVQVWMNRKRFQLRLPGIRPSKLDPFKDDIARMLERYPYTARQIYQQIGEQGFDGGYTIVKDHVRKVRPQRKKAFLKLAFAPGECGQVDWGSYGSIRVGNTTRRLSFFVMVLCSCRMMYVEFTVSQTMEHFLGCQQRAFEFFGGVPAHIMVDNLKSAVLKRTPGRDPVFNPRYLDFAGHYGFQIKACGVRKGNEKGMVENAVGYIKKNFLAGLDPGDFAAVNPAAKNWLETTANVRIHGETRQRPVDMFPAEFSCLLPLPIYPYDTATVHQVRASKQFRVTLDSNRYTVPARYAGIRLTLKAFTDRVCIYHEGKLVARHTRSYDRHRDIEDPDHSRALLVWKRKARDQKTVMRFLNLSSSSERYYTGLKERKLNLMHHIRQIVALSEIYDPDLVARAIEDACSFAAFSCEYIANLLEQRKRVLKDPGPLQLTRNEDLLELSLDRPDMALYDRRCCDEQ